MQTALLRALLASSSILLFACSGASQAVGGAPTDAGQTSSAEPSAPADEDDDSSASAPKQEDAGASTQTSGPVTIKNLSVSPTYSGFTLTFALANASTASIERVQEVTVQLGTGKPITYAIECQNPSWLIGGGSSTGVLEIEVSVDSSFSRMEHTPNCGSVFGSPMGGSASKVTLELKGLLDDAAPWKARAETAS